MQSVCVDPCTHACHPLLVCILVVDTKLGEVKMGEIGSWLSRRNYNPQSMYEAVARCKTLSVHFIGKNLHVFSIPGLCQQGYSAQL